MPRIQEPELTARRDTVRELRRHGFTPPMIAKIREVKTWTVANDKNLAEGMLPTKELFAARLALWLSRNARNIFSAHLNAEELEIMNQVLHQRVMADLNSPIEVIFEGLIRPALEGEPYQWLLSRQPLSLLPPIEELWMRVLEINKDNLPNSPQEAAVCFMAFVEERYGRAIHEHNQGRGPWHAQVPYGVRAEIFELREGSPNIAKQWDTWIAACEALRPSRDVRMSRTRIQNRKRHELWKLRFPLLQALEAGNPNIARYRAWQEAGVEGAELEKEKLRREIGSLRTDLAQALTALLAANERLEGRELLPVRPDDISADKVEISDQLFRRVDELELSVRSSNCLQRAGIEYIWQLVEKSEAEMLKTKNFGRKSLNEIKEILEELGLKLSTKIPRHHLLVLKKATVERTFLT